MKSPLSGGILGKRYNRTLHGRSVHRKTDVPGHNVCIGYSRPGTGDGLDIFCPASTEVYAMHDGVVQIIKDRNGRLSYVYIRNGRTFTVYAHIYVKASLQVGSTVKAGELIGWVNKILKDPHLHLEVWPDGKILHDSKPAGLAKKIQELIANNG
ncbi:MAG: M23 family metallopeptidase [Armatimonadota bacterium]